ncbi:MAG: exodeoxyribonuclease VII large subunit [Prolixibacteraceae bacterium]
MNDQLTLSELNSLIKETLELSFPDHLWVIAEIGELKVNRSGHCYLELVEKNPLTDEIKARSRATIWSWQFRFIQPYFETTTGQSLQAGLKVMVSVSIEFHEVYGMSLNIKDIDPNYTLGDMARKRQEVVNRLIKEGVFEMNKEIPLADLPARIAIISSPTAAGYEDFMMQLKNNEAGYVFYTKLFPASMQGTDSSKSIVQALEYIYEWEEAFDAVVIIRGGGSQLDLSCFDDYDLALNIAQFPLPVLTGIGHEKDDSIADMVAHTKLKTPTAVAEFLIARFDEVATEINELERSFFSEVDQLISKEQTRLEQAFKFFKPLIKSKIEKTQMQLHHLAQGIQPLVNEMLDREKHKLEKHTNHFEFEVHSIFKLKMNQLKLFANKTEFASHLFHQKEAQLIEEKGHRLIQQTKSKIEAELNRLHWLEKTKELVDPGTILKRGFSITLKDGKALKNASLLKNGDELETIFSNGKVKSIVKK